MKKTSKKELKEEAQSRLLSAMSIAFNQVEDTYLTREQKDALSEMMDREMKRVEKMFGYDPGSFMRGV